MSTIELRKSYTAKISNQPLKGTDSQDNNEGSDKGSYEAQMSATRAYYRSDPIKPGHFRKA